MTQANGVRVKEVLACHPSAPVPIAVIHLLDTSQSPSVNQSRQGVISALPCGRSRDTGYTGGVPKECRAAVMCFLGAAARHRTNPLPLVHIKPRRLLRGSPAHADAGMYLT